jgi:hypothetical protein
MREPFILAAEGNLVLIGLKHATKVVNEPTDYKFFVYHAPTRGHESESQSPTLQLLPQPIPGLFPRTKYCHLTQGDVGILRYRANKEEYDAYKIATLYARFRESELIRYDLFIYDGSTKAWTCEPTFFPQQPPLKFRSEKVITIDGTMVWVDLSRGMILCDLHVPPEEESTGGGPRQLRYIRLPTPLLPRASPIRVSCSSFYRDIAVVDDLIKFVDLEYHDSRPAGPEFLDRRYMEYVSWCFRISQGRGGEIC